MMGVAGARDDGQIGVGGTGGVGSMSIELDLPNGLSIEIAATPVRCEKRDEGYLIGARISDMTARDRELFEEYLREIEGK